ncbi:zinc ribbon domain-containing protein [Pseudodesulfovibrio sp.]|uniref:FmdB family zinc ribbon protein n=1 Tax=Pseudodesulfovibrio sp. TaxID=2035812 RepID=UPI00262DF493|nr:zinc ribbon domain-containing protein [Pseudodesulfovibrio sp.]MDD3310735.1 zinc ribbon domain-containing protein [Pseudodesulfovibrio sp.]
MPIYEYQCEKCGSQFEELVFSHEETPACPHCGAPGARKLMSACAVRPEGEGSSPGPMPAAGSCGGHSGFG